MKPIPIFDASTKLVIKELSTKDKANEEIAEKQLKSIETEQSKMEDSVNLVQEEQLNLLAQADIRHIRHIRTTEASAAHAAAVTAASTTATVDLTSSDQPRSRN